MDAKCMSAFVVVAVLCAAHSIEASISLPLSYGACPTPPVVENFDVSQYSGVWYEYKRFPVPYEFLGTCGQARYEVINSTAISVNNSGIRQVHIAGRSLFRKRTGAVGLATMPDPSQPAKLVVSFPNTRFSQFARGDYWVLASDYSSFALVYSCTMGPFGLFHYDAAWILTRQRGVAPGNVEFLESLLRDSGVDPRHFFLVQQTNCDMTTETDEQPRTVFYRTH